MATESLDPMRPNLDPAIPNDPTAILQNPNNRASVESSVSVAPSQYQIQHDQEYQRLANEAALSTARDTFLPIYNVLRDKAYETELSFRNDPKFQAELDRQKALTEAENLKYAGIMGGEILKTETGVKTWNESVSEAKSQLEQDKLSLDRAASVDEVQTISSRLRDDLEKFSYVVNQNPFEIPDKTIRLYNTGQNFASGFGIGGLFTLGGDDTGGKQRAAQEDQRLSLATGGQVGQYKAGEFIGSSPSGSSADIQSAIDKLSANPFAEATPAERTAYDVFRQLNDKTSTYSVSGLKNFENALSQFYGTTEAKNFIQESLKPASPVPAIGTVQGSLTASIGMEEKKPISTPVSTIGINDIQNLQRPFLSTAGAKEQASRDAFNIMGGISAFLKGTPLGSALLGGTPQEKEQAQENKNALDRYLNFISPAIGMSGGGVKVPASMSVKPSASFLETILGGNPLRLPASKGISTLAIVPFLNIGSKAVESKNYVSGQPAFVGKLIGETTPNNGKYASNLKFGLFSEDFYSKEKPSDLQSGSLNLKPWGTSEQFGGGVSKESYISQKAIPGNVDQAFILKNPDNTTAYFIKNKDNSYELINDVGIWRSSGSPGAFAGLLENRTYRNAINPLATGLEGKITYGTEKDVNEYLTKYGKPIDLTDKNVIGDFYTNLQSKKERVVALNEAISTDYQDNVMRHRYERENNIPSLSVDAWHEIQNKMSVSAKESGLPNVSKISFVGDNYKLPSIKSGILDTNPFGDSPVQNMDQFGTMKKYEGLINASIESGKPINSTYIKDLDNSSLTYSQKENLKTWLSGYNESLKIQGTILSELKDDNPNEDYNKLYGLSLDLAKYSPESALIMRSNIENSERITKANSIIGVLADIKTDDQTRQVKEKELTSIISGINDSTIKGKYSALPSEYRAFAGLSGEIALTSQLTKPLSDSEKASKIQTFNNQVDSQLPDFDTDTKTNLKTNYANYLDANNLISVYNSTTKEGKVMDNAQLYKFGQDVKANPVLNAKADEIIAGITAGRTPEATKPLSFGGVISDFTQSFGNLKSGNIFGGYEAYQRGISRVSTLPLIPDISGFGKYVAERDTSQSPVGTAVQFGAFTTESIVKNTRERPIEDIALYFLPTGFKLGEYGVARTISGAVKSELPGITTIGKLASSPIASDVGKVAKGGLLGIYGVQSYQHITDTEVPVVGSTISKLSGQSIGNNPKNTEGYGTRSGDVIYQIGMMSAGIPFANSISLSAIDNPAAGRSFITGEREFSPLEVSRQTISAKLNSYDIPAKQKGARSAYTSIPKIFRSIRFTEPSPGTTEGLPKGKPFSEPNIEGTIGKQRGMAVKEVLKDEPHVIMGSSVVESQKSGLPESIYLRIPPKDVDMRVNNPESVKAKLHEKGVGTGGLDIKQFEEGYPNIGQTQTANEGITIKSLGTRLLGEPISNVKGAKLPYLDELLLAGEDYKGTLNQEKLQVQMARKMQATMQDMLPAESKAGNTEAREMNEQFRLPKDLYDTITISKDLVQGEAVRTGKTIPSKQTALSSIKDLDNVEWKFGFMPKEDNPVIGAKAGVYFDKTLKFGQIRRLYEDAVIRERYKRLAGKSGGSNKEVEYDFEPAKKSPSGILPSSGSFFEQYAGSSIITGGTKASSSPLISESVKSSGVSKASIESIYSPSPSPSSSQKYSGSPITSPKLSNISGFSPSSGSPTYSGSSIPSSIVPSSPTIVPSSVPSRNPTYVGTYVPYYQPFQPRITIPPPIGGGIGMGGGSDNRDYFRLKRRTIAQPIATGTELLRGSWNQYTSRVGRGTGLRLENLRPPRKVVSKRSSPAPQKQPVKPLNENRLVKIAGKAAMGGGGVKSIQNGILGATFERPKSNIPKKTPSGSKKKSKSGSGFNRIQDNLSALLGVNTKKKRR